MSTILHSLAFCIPYVLNASLAASVLAVCLLVINYRGRQVIPFRAVYFLWVLVAIRMVLFVCPSSQFSCFNWVPDSLAQTSKHVELQIDSDSHLPDLRFGAAEKLAAWPAPVALFEGPTEITRPKFSWLAAASIVWLCGLVFLFARMAIQAIATRRLVQNSNVVERNDILAAFEDCQAQICIKRNIRLAETKRLPMPVIVGLFRPTILIPTWCLEEMDREQIKLILLHELVHFKQGDVSIHLAASIVRILHWFNPFATAMHRRICQLREICCDQRVLALVANHPSYKTLYGNTVIQVAERCTSSTRPQTWTRGLIGAATAPSNQHSLFERIQMINSSHSIHRFSCLFAFALIGGVIITTFTSAQQAVPSPGQLPSVEESRYLKLPPAALPDLQAGEPMLFVAPACAQAEILLPPAQVDTAKHQFAHKLVILEGDVQTMNRFLDHFADPEDAIPAKRFFDDDRKGAFYLPLKNFDTPEGQVALESLNLKPIASPAIIVTDPSMPAQFVMGGEIPYPIVKKNEQGLRVQTMEMRSLGFALKLFCQIKDDWQLVQLVDVADRQLDGNVEVIMETADGFVRVGQPQIVGRQLQCAISGSFDVPLAFCCSGKTAGEIHAAKAQDVKRVIVIQTRRIENQNTSPEETESDTEAKPGDAEEQFSFFLGNGR